MEGVFKIANLPPTDDAPSSRLWRGPSSARPSGIVKSAPSMPSSEDSFASVECTRKKTALFDVREEPHGIKRFVAVTVGQIRIPSDDHRDSSRSGPVLPPLYSVWVRITSDFGYQRTSPQSLFIHWGVCLRQNDWHLPLTLPELPTSSFIWNNAAVRSPMISRAASSSSRSVVIKLGQAHQCPVALQFVLYSPAYDTWGRAGGNANFHVPLQAVIAELQLATVRDTLLSGRRLNAGSISGNEDGSCHDVALYCPSIPDVHHIFEMPSRNAEVDVAIWTTDEAVIVEIITNLRQEAILHWGFLTARPALSQLQRQGLAAVDCWEEVWEPPDPRLRPPDNVACPEHPGAVQTLFQRGLQGPEASLVQSVRLVFPHDVIFERVLQKLEEEDESDHADISSERFPPEVWNSGAWQRGSHHELQAAGSETRHEWWLPVLRDSQMDGCFSGAFPQRLAFVLKTRQLPTEWMHNECLTSGEEYKFELCPLLAPPDDEATRGRPAQHGKVIRHTPASFSALDNPSNRNYEVSIPFSETFKARLFRVLQKNAEERDLVRRIQHADFVAIGTNSSWSSHGKQQQSAPQRSIVQPLLSTAPTTSNRIPARFSEVCCGSFSTALCPAIAPLNSSGIITLLTPPPMPGTVVFFNTYSLDDPGGRGVVHVLAVEEAAVACGSPSSTNNERLSSRKEVRVSIKVHIMVSINVPCVIHWGLLCDRKGSQWIRPEEALWPEGTEPFDSVSVDSPMKIDPRSRMCRLELKLPERLILESRREVPKGLGGGLKTLTITGIAFVLKDVMTDRWIKQSSGRDLYVRLRRERYPDFLARQWRGAHTNLVIRLLQNELRFDPAWPVATNQRYVALSQLATTVNYDRLDTDYWAWIFVWWRFSHLRIFDWQRHAHSRSWEAIQLAQQTSEAVVSHWRGSARSRPIIKLLLQHLLCLRENQDVRKDLHCILSSWHLLGHPFFEQWYRKMHNSVGVEDFVICRAVIAMLRSLNVSAFWETLGFYGFSSPDCLEQDFGLSAPPAVPPAFSFLQAQLFHIAQLNIKGASATNPNQMTRAETLSQVNPLHPSTSFIARHIEQQTARLRGLVDSLEGLSSVLESLFFGPTLQVAFESARESMTAELVGVSRELRDLQISLRPTCPKVSGAGLPAETITPEQHVKDVAVHHRIFEAASRGRSICAPVLSHCTDNRIVRDFMIMDIALDNLQRTSLSRIFGFTGPPLKTFISQPRSGGNILPICARCNSRHNSWNHPLALLVPSMRRRPQERMWTLSIECPAYRLGLVVRLLCITANLLPGLKMLHPSVEEANALMNDWAVLVSQGLPGLDASELEQTAIAETLCNGEMTGEFVNFAASFVLRVQRCASRIVDLCLVYFSDKVKFLYTCLSELDLYTPSYCGERLESATSPPVPPRAFTGDDPSIGWTESLSQSALEADLLITGRSERALRDVHSFVLGVVKHSALFWIVLSLARIASILRGFTYVPAWRLLSSVYYATGSLVIVNSMEDLKSETGGPVVTFIRPVLLVVRHVIGHERVPFNTRALIMGPAVFPIAPSQNQADSEEALICLPHLLSPLALQARQMSIMGAVCLDPSDFDRLINCLQANRLKSGDAAEIFIPEHLSEIVVRGLDPEITRDSSDATNPTLTSHPSGTSLSPQSSSQKPYHPEDDALLARRILSRLRNPKIVSSVLPPQSGPLFPSLRYYCPSPIPPARLVALSEDSLSGQSTTESTTRSWGQWNEGSLWIAAIPVVNPSLFDKLYTTCRWFLTPHEFSPLLVGGRGYGFQKLRGIRGFLHLYEAIIHAEAFDSSTHDFKVVTVPTLAVPFGALEATLRDPENHALSEKLRNLLTSLHAVELTTFNRLEPTRASINRDESTASFGSVSVGPTPSAASLDVAPLFATSDLEKGRGSDTRRCERLLRECRTVVRALKPTRDFLLALKDLVERKFDPETDWDKWKIGAALGKNHDKMWTNIKNVWCSSFTPAVWHVTQVVNIPTDTPRFSVLIQVVEPLAYSFRLDTSQDGPSQSFHNTRGMLDRVDVSSPACYGEVMSGLPLSPGELFSGGHLLAGRPLAFVQSMNIADGNDPKVLCFSSQPHILRLRRTGLLLRPDVNIFGLGSVMPSGGLVCACVDPPARNRFECQREPIYSDPRWRNAFLSQLTKIASLVKSRVPNVLSITLEGGVWPGTFSGSQAGDPNEVFSVAPSATRVQSPAFFTRPTISDFRHHKIVLLGATITTET